MKKIWAVIFAAVLMIGAGTTDVLAGAARSCGSYRANCSFIDEDGDGICDNCAGGVCGGIGRGSRYANCAFVDEDGDGICDNCAEGVCGGIGRGSRHANCSFVDEDGDGICDNCAGGVCRQNAVGRGHHNKKGGRHRNR